MQKSTKTRYTILMLRFLKTHMNYSAWLPKCHLGNGSSFEQVMFQLLILKSLKKQYKLMLLLKIFQNCQMTTMFVANAMTTYNWKCLSLIAKIQN